MTTRTVALALVVLGALWLRMRELDRRPMHADEANQAVRLGELLETGRYTFDPHDHHGPTLSYAGATLARARGATTLAALDETTVRLLPALAGTAAVLLVYALAVPLGIWPAVGAAALYAVAPPAVYYSRYFIHETLLAAALLATFVSVRAWWTSGRTGWALLAGSCLGLALATKASAVPLALLAAGAAWPFAPARPDGAAATRHLALAVLVASLVAALLYSSFGSNPAGLRDAVATYALMWGRVGSGSGHEHPWWFYLERYFFHRSGGLLWQELAFGALALAGACIAIGSRRPVLRWAAVYTVAIGAMLGIMPYKTPWNGVHLLAGLAVLGAGALAAIPRARLAVAVAVGVMALQAKEAWRTAFTRPSEERNPFAYVHSSPDVLKLRPLATVALKEHSDAVVRVISEEYWPVPWYLRGLPRVGYWSQVPPECDGALVVSSASLADDVRACLRGDYQESYLGLRPGFVLVVFRRVG